MTAEQIEAKKARVAEALRLHDEGLSIKQTAERMGVAHETVRRYLRANGIPFVKKPTNKGTRKLPCGSLKHCSSLIRMLIVDGIAANEIAKVIGCSPSTVTNFKSRHGMSGCVNKRIPDEVAHEWLELANSGFTTYEIGARYGRPHSSVSRVLRRMGLVRTRGSHACNVTKTCDYCGCKFKPTRNNQRYCSSRCRNLSFGNGSSVKRARKYGVPYDRTINLKRLIERDGLRCSICGKTCDMDDKQWGDYGPDYPTIDHIVPLSKGGPHLWSNVQVACAECNIAKGASAD